MSYKNLRLKDCPGEIFYGCVPSVQDMSFLRHQKCVNIVWNLLMELPEIIKIEKSIFPEVFHSPIHDFQAPKKGSNFLMTSQEVCFRLEMGQKVFIHCLGGRGRTGMAIATLLIMIDKLSITDALKKSNELCHGPENESQKNFIRRAFSL